MSFLELKPAARRLRQVAKAHAAGELPRADYRRVRREVIEELHVDFSDPHRANSVGLPVVGDFSLGTHETTRRLDAELAGVCAPVARSSARPIRMVALGIIVLGLLVGLSLQ